MKKFKFLSYYFPPAAVCIDVSLVGILLTPLPLTVEAETNTTTFSYFTHVYCVISNDTTLALADSVEVGEALILGVIQLTELFYMSS